MLDHTAAQFRGAGALLLPAQRPLSSLRACCRTCASTLPSVVSTISVQCSLAAGTQNQTHSNSAHLREHAAVRCLDHGVDDRLGVDHDLDVIVVNAVQVVRLDHLETLGV